MNSLIIQAKQRGTVSTLSLPTTVTMDESKEALLGSSRQNHDHDHDRDHSSPDAGFRDDSPRVRESFSSDLDADLDATDYLTTDPLAGHPSASDPKPTFLSHQKSTCSRPLRKLFHSRSRCCIVAGGILLMIWLLVAAGGAVIYKKFRKEPLDGQSPPWFPASKGGISASWAESYQRASVMVGKMTLPEKVNVTTGTGWMMGLAVGTNGPAVHVGFPQLQLQDGPLGLRFADNATAFPAGITVGATWSKELMYARGKAHGQEARGKGINVLLGPCVGPLGRMPAGGRNWEGFGSDPYLQGVAGAETVKGIQSEGVMATVRSEMCDEPCRTERY